MKKKSDIFEERRTQFYETGCGFVPFDVKQSEQ
jgi:hypothetical protein